MTAYYNEIDPYCAAWLRNLIAADLIPPGDVDTRSITDVQPEDVRGYTQCHFFAGIGGWGLATRLAGWPDERPIWTGSCPCPPFSVAGKKKNCPRCGNGVVPCPRRTGYFICTVCDHAWFADGRHLFPEFWRLIADCHPPTIMGEQVAGEDGRIWFAGVRAALEICAYAVGGADITSAGVGAPNIRNRMYWVADATSDGYKRSGGSRRRRNGLANGGTIVRISDSYIARLEIRPRKARQRGTVRNKGATTTAHCIGDGRLDDSAVARRSETEPDAVEAVRNGARREQPERRGCDGRPSFWDEYAVIGPDPEGKYRRIEPGTSPLVTRLPGHVGQIRAYGNAINPQVAAEVIAAYLDLEDEE